MEEIVPNETSFPSIPFRRSTSQEGHSVFDLVVDDDASVKGNIFLSHEINLSMFSDAQYCYSILEAMPLPGPTWSTTAPCVMAEPPSTAPFEGSLELEWGENHASSYAWWLGFLESLDDNVAGENLDHSFVESNFEKENCKVLGLDSSFVDAIDLSCCPDDWLITPTMEKDLGDYVVLP